MSLYLSGFVESRFRVYKVDEPNLSVGRSTRNSIHLPDPTVSKEHAEISKVGDDFLLRDLGSRNGTTINGTEAKQPMRLKPGDQVEFGDVKLVVTAEEPHTPPLLNESASLVSSVRISVDEVLRANAEPASARLLGLLAQAGQLLVLLRPLRETCDEIVSIVDKALPASRICLLMRGEGSDELVQVAARFRGGRTAAPLALSKTMVDTVLREGTSVLTSDAMVDPRFKEKQSIVVQGIRSAMAVPLYNNEKILGMIYADTDTPGSAYGREHLEVLTLLANMAAMKITNVHLLEAQRARERIELELATAAQIQRNMLPTGALPLEGYDMHAIQEPCWEVGGDFYDYRITPDGRLYLLVGDVTGKGMGAALLMTSFLAYSRALCTTAQSPADFVGRLNGMFCEMAAPGHFATLFAAFLDPPSGKIGYVNAGHPSPFVIGDGGCVELGSGGPPVGIIAGATYEERTVEMAPGSVMAVFSDGISEARKGDEFFELDRVIRLLAEKGGRGRLDELSREVILSIDSFFSGAPRNDDVTLLLLRRARSAETSTA